MSHFIVGVITKDPKNFQEELAPFDEQTEDPKYLEFVDETEKAHNRWETETSKKIKLPNGEYISDCDERLRVYITKEEYEKPDGIHKGSHWDPAKKETLYYRYDPSLLNGVEVDVPLKELYPDFKEFADHYGYEWDEEHQAYGYMHNPNAKYDSYGLCAVGNYSRWQWATLEEAFIKVKDYPLYKDKAKLIEEYNKAKELAEKESASGIDKFNFNYNYAPCGTAEEYAEKHLVDAPWAFELEGHWAERGEMGWFAMSDATDESEEAFKKKFVEIMTDPKYQDYYIGFINAHI